MTLSVDDIVTWTARLSPYTFRTNYGIVTRITDKGGVTVRYLDRALKPHGEPVKFRAGSRDIPKKATELEVARLRWLSERPRPPTATMQFKLGASDADPPESACVNQNRLTSPEDLRKAAADLITLAEWWEKMPGSA